MTANGRPQTNPPPGSASQVSSEPGTETNANAKARPGYALRGCRADA